MNLKHTALALVAPLLIHAQDAMTPETLWQLRKISFQCVSPDHSLVVYKTSQSDLATEKNTHKSYLLNTVSYQSSAFNIGEKSFIQWDKNGLYAFENGKIYISKDKGNSWREFYTIGKDAQNIKISPDGQKVAFSKEVQLEKIYGKDIHKDLPKTTAQIYTDLNHRHWDTWHEGKFNHIFVVNTKENVAKAKDLLEGKPFDTPQKPFGGQEDFVWSPDSKQIVYVTKTKSGKEYAISTNTDIFLYDLASGKTQNLSQGMMGYDVNPKFSPDGQYLLWQSMSRDGYESDKNDIILMNWKTKSKTNLTKNWDESVTGDTFWDNDSKNIYFTAAFRGTKQLFSVSQNKSVKQITNGKFDVNSVFAQNKNTLFVNRNDAQHSPDFYSVELKNGSMKQVTNINADFYQKMKVGHSELKMVKTTDGKEMGVWFHYPPDFDPNKKYPTLLYCQGGPQSALSQYFSWRWNFSLMNAHGYIVIAPNRRGMPGWGTQWNEQISKEWGGQAIKDYLSATDFAKSLPYVDSNRMGAVGASYGGYSVLMLAGLHENRFKTFISHNGTYDTKSWYGTTEELWFANWDMGGSPWDNPNAKSYTEYNPSTYAKNWNRPLMIIQGNIDFRVSYEQGQQAFQVARTKNLKSKFLYYPDENHWVLKPQNAIVWQREFFDWLKETL